MGLLEHKCYELAINILINSLMINLYLSKINITVCLAIKLMQINRYLWKPINTT